MIEYKTGDFTMEELINNCKLILKNYGYTIHKR